MAHVMKPGVWQPYVCDCTSVGVLHRAVPQICRILVAASMMDRTPFDS
jgi:hypothetical protein